MKQAAAALGLLLILSISASTVPRLTVETEDDSQLSAQIERIIARPEFRGALWGIQASDASDGSVLYEQDAMMSVVPASNTKIYTTAAALEQLGPEFRLVTRLYAQGTLRDGILDGSLFIRGAGDPTIAENLEEYGAPGVLEAWASATRAAGIARIAGDVVGDDDVFDDVPYPRGWSWDDLTFYYAPEIGGLAYNQNVFDLVVEPRAAGMPGIA